MLLEFIFSIVQRRADLLGAAIANVATLVPPRDQQEEVVCEHLCGETAIFDGYQQPNSLQLI